MRASTEHRLNCRLLRCLLSVATAIAVSLPSQLQTASAALAISPPVSVPFSAVTLSGGDAPSTATPAIGITDSDAASGGWNITLSTTAFTDGKGATLPEPALSIRSSPSVACTSTCSSMPISTVSYPVAIPQNNTPVKWFNASAGSGLGSFTITPTLTLMIAANSFAGSYTATETFSILTGP